MSLPYGNKVVPRSTPMHVETLALQLLRCTFKYISEDDDYPYKLTDDFATSNILIDTEFNKVSEVIATKPAIIVASGAISAGTVMLGDKLAHSMRLGGSTLKSNMVRSSLTVRVFGRTRAEAMIVGNEVFNFLLMCRTWLPRMVGVQVVDQVQMSPPMPYEQDTRMYTCEANLGYAMQYKWTDLVPVEPLNNIGMFINSDETMDLGEPDPVEGPA